MRYESEIFRTEPSGFVRLKARSCLLRWLWVFAAVYALLVYASLRDARFIYVGLIVTFIVWPMLLTFGWLSAVASPDVIRRSRPRRVTVDGGGLVFKYIPREENNQDAACVEELRIPFSELTAFETRGAYILMRYGPGRGEVDLIPAGILSSEIRDYVRSAMPGMDDELA